MKALKTIDQVSNEHLAHNLFESNWILMKIFLEFRGEKVKSAINGETIRYFSDTKRKQLLRQSFIIITMMIVLVCVVTGGIYVARFILRSFVGEGNASLYASIANALLIQFFNFAYNQLAFALTERENHRCFHSHEKHFSLI